MITGAAVSIFEKKGRTFATIYGIIKVKSKRNRYMEVIYNEIQAMH